jgi:hypothetical protein
MKHKAQKEVPDVANAFDVLIEALKNTTGLDPKTLVFIEPDYW